MNTILRQNMEQLQSRRTLQPSCCHEAHAHKWSEPPRAGPASQAESLAPHRNLKGFKSNQI